MRALCWLGLFFFAAACGECHGGGATSLRPGEPRNLVFIIIDTLRADELESWGGPTEAPHIEALAAEGVRFEWAFSHAPITGPSHASMFTSLLPRDHGVHNNSQRFRDDWQTLPELMQRSGRRTAAFVSLQALDDKYGFSQGFDEYHDEFPRFWWKSSEELNRDVLPWLHEHAHEPFFLWVHYSDPHEPYLPPDWYQPIEIRFRGERVANVRAEGRPVRLELSLSPGDNALEFRPDIDHPVRFSHWKLPEGVSVEFGEGLQQSRGARRPYQELRPGTPQARVVLRNHDDDAIEAQVRFDTSVRLSRRESRRGYSRETAFADRQLGRLIDKLRELDAWRDTMIILTSDHGEELGERGRFGHVHHLFDSLIHVPLIMAHADGLHAGRVEQATVRHIDLLPTLREIFRLPEDGRMRGESLLPLEDIGPRPVVAETYRPQARADRVAVRFGRYKLVHDKTAGRFQLYRPGTEQGEREDLLRGRALEQLPEPLAQAFERGHELLRAPDRDGEAAQPIATELSEEDKEALRALGYIE